MQLHIYNYGVHYLANINMFRETSPFPYLTPTPNVQGTYYYASIYMYSF